MEDQVDKMNVCSNCGSNNVRVKDRRVHWATKPYHHVVCGNCECTGKVCKREEDAIAAWDEMTMKNFITDVVQGGMEEVEIGGDGERMDDGERMNGVEA